MRSRELLRVPAYYVLMVQHQGTAQSRPIPCGLTQAAWIDAHTGQERGNVWAVINQDVRAYLVLSERPGWHYIAWYRESSDTYSCSCFDGTQKSDCPHKQHLRETYFKPYSIYALVDPRNDTVRYIGMSSNPTRRYVSHLHEQANRLKKDWIAELKSVGLKPVLRILEETKTYSSAEIREYYWINFYRRAGTPLTNMVPKPT